MTQELFLRIFNGNEMKNRENFLIKLIIVILSELVIDINACLRSS